MMKNKIGKREMKEMMIEAREDFMNKNMGMIYEVVAEAASVYGNISSDEEGRKFEEDWVRGFREYFERGFYEGAAGYYDTWYDDKKAGRAYNAGYHVGVKLHDGDVHVIGA